MPVDVALAKRKVMEAVVDGVNHARMKSTNRIKRSFPPGLGASSTGNSSPGSPPAVRTGSLRRAIDSDPAKISGHSVVARVGSTGLPYDKIQEYGGMAGRGHKTHIPPRPYLRPEMERMRGGALLSDILAGIKRSL